MSTNAQVAFRFLILMVGLTGLAMLFVTSTASPLFLLNILLVSLYFLIFLILHKRNDLSELNAEFVVHLLFGFYFIVPISVLLFDKSSVLDESLYVKVLLCIMIGLVGFMLAYSVPWRVNLDRVMPNLDGAWDEREARLVGWGLIVVGLVLIAILIQQVGIWTFVSSTYVSQYGALRGKGILAAGGNLLKIGVLVLFLASSRPGGKTPRFAVLAALALALIHLRVGRRHLVLSLALGLIAIQHKYIKKVPLWVFVVGTSVALVVFSVVGTARARMAEGTDEMVMFVRDEFSEEWIWRFLDEPSAVILTLRETIQRYPEMVEYRYGGTVVEAFQILVPQVIWPDRPLAPCQEFAYYYAPLRAQAGAGFSFSILAEGYMNFGYFGILLVCFLTGVFLRGLSTYISKNPESKGRMLYFASWISVAVVFVRGDIAGLLKVGFVTSVLPSILAGMYLGRSTMKARGRALTNISHGL